MYTFYCLFAEKWEVHRVPSLSQRLLHLDSDSTLGPHIPNHPGNIRLGSKCEWSLVHRPFSYFPANPDPHPWLHALPELQENGGRGMGEIDGFGGGEDVESEGRETLTFAGMNQLKKPPGNSRLKIFNKF